jgi:predicted pyridoxine 5'-phosphate oxidase superfamily flavin-nucleotide-binding protein
MASWGFHEGELAVQRLAGVSAEAGRLEPMLKPADLSGGAAKFLAAQNFAVLTARDGNRELWTSPLAGRPGFLRGDGDVLRIAAVPRRGDPLHDMPVGQPVGLIAVDFAARRRLRINGLLIEADQDGLVIRADQAYGNCPQYIHQRHPDDGALAATPSAGAHRATTLSLADREFISAADTFFFGTTHPSRGSDASHKGGPAGFVRVDSETHLSWPDLPGNNMFNSFGNLAVDDEAALLFVDFDSGATLHLSGAAGLRWTPPEAPDQIAGRQVEFTVAAVVEQRVTSSR